jgi:anthranilate phosphoribosyltransferase
VVADGAIQRRVVSPEEAGLSRSPLEAIRGGEAAENAAALLTLFQGGTGAYRDTVVLNSAAALIVAGRADTLKDGAAQAVQAIEAGAALAALDRLRQATA